MKGAASQIAAALLAMVLVASVERALTAPLSTPWVSLEVMDKDRAIFRKPWVTYEASDVISFNSVQQPISIESALDPANYRITSTAGMASSISILEVSYRSRVLFASLTVTSTFPEPAAWGYHVFLKLATSLENGERYNVTALTPAFGREVTLQLAVNEEQQLNENIHVNQVGYTLAGPKRAIVGGYLGSSTAQAPYIPATLQLPRGTGSTFTVVNAVTGAVAFSGTAQLFGDGAIHPYYKQLSWHLDFSALDTPGRYYIRLPGLGVSHTFTVATDALQPALGAISRTLYGQRCGVALDPQHLSPWERPEACHVDDAEVLAVDPLPDWFKSKLPVPNTSNTTTLPPDPITGSYLLPQAAGGTRISAVGGHHDAGDYGKYVINSGSLVGWLMDALEVLGAEHDDLPLPEAGDGVPDIMQIVAHELKFLEGMQDTDGGVYCVVKPNSTAGEYYEHHPPCGTPGKDQCNFAANDPRRGPRIAWPKDTTCTAQFAGAMARAARSPWFKTLRPNDAARYLSRAVKAWDFLAAKAPYGALCYHHYGCLGVVSAADATPAAWQKLYNCFDPQGDHSHDERVWAAVELYAATGEAKYHEYFLERHCPRYRRWGWVMLPFSYGLATVTYAQLAAQAKAGDIAIQVNGTMASRCVEELATTARGYTQQARASPYFLAVPERSFQIFGYGWQFQTSVAAHMLMSAALAGSNATEVAEWKEMAAMQLYYILGVNPQGFSLITGLGARRIINAVDDESVYDDLVAPWPGQLIGLASGFSWLNEYGSALGKAFPPGSDYGVFNRIADVFNVKTEYTVPEIALALGAVAALAGYTKSPLPAKPVLTVQQSISSGTAPLTVNFQLSVSGDPEDIATVEYDFGDGAHSYQANINHTYTEPGRAFYGFATVVDRRGQAVTQKFAVFTSFGAGSSYEDKLPPLSGLQLVAGIHHAAGTASALPPLLVASALPALGTNASLSTSIAADAAGAISASSDNLAWQGPKAAWQGAALRPVRYDDRISYAIDTGSPQAMQALLNAASGGLVLEAWLYFDQFLTYSRDNAQLLGLLGTNKNYFFGLLGTKWSGNMLVAGGLGTVANDTNLKPALPLGRWHHVRLEALPSATGNGTCSAWVDGTLVAQREDCSPAKIFNYCATSGQTLKLVAGSFNGYIDAVRVFASPTGNISSFCGPPPPPPKPSPSPAPPATDNRFAPLIIDAATIAVMDADASCGLSGGAVNSSLPLKLYSNGAANGGYILPAAATYTAGLAVNNSNVRWAVTPYGCSLQVTSDAVTDGSAGVRWQLPRTLLQAAITANAFTVEAKLFVEVWRKGYSKWNADVLGTGSNWDTFFKISHDIWKGPRVVLQTPSASTTGAFAGTLVNETTLESIITPGSWHHVAFVANSTMCVLSVNSVEVAAGKCEAKKLLWQTNVDLYVGGFVGWLDELAVSAAARPTQVPNTAPNNTVPPPPRPFTPTPPSPSPAPPGKPDNRFTPLIIDSATIAVMDADASCGLSGGAVNSSLPLKLYNNSATTGTSLLPAAATYTAGLAVDDNNTRWAVTPFGCSLRVASAPVADGSAGVRWRLPRTLLLPAITANAFTVEAKLFVEVWRRGYSKWNADVLGTGSNWDTFFKISHDIWKGPRVVLQTPSASTTGAFAGTLVNETTLESIITPGSWHHVAFVANSTMCVLSVNSVEVAAGKCEAKKLLWQTNVDLYVGGFVGWLDELAVSAAARPTQVPQRP